MDYLERKELVHTHPGMPDEDFMRAIDATGGWPVGWRYVQFYHAEGYEDRVCMFNNSGRNTGWWTTVCTADDYYWWKLSDEKKAEVVKQARQAIIDKLRMRE